MLLLIYLLCSFGSNLESIYLNDFMELGVGARALGLGNAFVGLADDATSVYWNPAGLSRLKKPELFLMNSNDFNGEITLNAGALGYPLKSAAVGVGLYMIECPEIPLTDTTKTTDSTESGEIIDTGIINATDYIGYLSYVRSFNSLGLGINLKYILRNWGFTTASGVQLDIGLSSEFKGINYGINIVNLLGTPISYSDSFDIKDNVPMLIRYGVALKHSFYFSQVAFCLGFDTSPEERVCEFPSLHTDTYLGFEYWWKQQVALRLGADRGNITLGCGIAYQGLKLDYAFKFHNDLGVVKRLSGSINF